MGKGCTWHDIQAAIQEPELILELRLEWSIVEKGNSVFSQNTNDSTNTCIFLPLHGILLDFRSLKPSRPKRSSCFTRWIRYPLTSWPESFFISFLEALENLLALRQMYINFSFLPLVLIHWAIKRGLLCLNPAKQTELA